MYHITHRSPFYQAGPKFLFSQKDDKYINNKTRLITKNIIKLLRLIHLRQAITNKQLRLINQIT